MARGYYTRAVLAAWDFRARQGAGKLKSRWVFDSDSSEANQAYRGQGNHNLSVADVDGDGRDEIVYGAAVIDDDGKGLYSTGWGHGDALHVSDLDPGQSRARDLRHPGALRRPGHEPARCAHRQAAVHDSLREGGRQRRRQGRRPGPRRRVQHRSAFPGRRKLGRGRRHERHVRRARQEVRAKAGPPAYPPTSPSGGTATCCANCSTRTSSANGTGQTQTLEPLLVAHQCTSNNGTKATPALSADLWGDWREEVIWRTRDNRELRIYTTTIPTPHRMVTLMQDPQYRLAIAWQNVAYNQPPHPSFYLDEAAPLPKKPADPLYARLRSLKLRADRRLSALRGRRKRRARSATTSSRTARRCSRAAPRPRLSRWLRRRRCWCAPCRR